MTGAMFLQAMAEIRERLDEMNGVDNACGLPNLEDQDRTWNERAVELTSRAIFLETWARQPDDRLEMMDLALNSLAAHCVAMKIAIHKAADAREKRAA